MSRTFVDGLWGHGPDIFDAQNERLKTLDSLVAFFKEKSALDRYYSRTLKKLSKLHLIENETPGSPLQSFLHGFRDLIETVSTNYEIMAAKEADQMLNPLNKTKTKLLADNKTLRRESQKFSNHLRKLNAIHKRTRHEARMLCKESIVARKKCDGHMRAEKGVLSKLAAQRNKLQSRSRGLRDPSAGPQMALISRKMKSVKVQGFALAERSKNMKKEFDNADHKYVAAVKACREFRGKHDSTATTVLKGLEKTEGDRILVLKESVRRYLKVESEMSKKLLVSYQSVAAIAESVDVSDELQCYVQHFATGKTPKPLPEYIHFPSHEDVVFRDKFDPKDYQKAGGKRALPSSKTSQEEACEGSLVEEVKALVAAALEKGEEGESEAKRLDEMLQSKKGRAAFAAALNYHRNHGFDRKYAHGMELKRPVFDAIAKMMLHFLDHAHKAMDTSPAQLVMIISQTFFYYRRHGGEGGGGGGGDRKDEGGGGGDGDGDDDGKNKTADDDARAPITKEKM